MCKCKEGVIKVNESIVRGRSFIEVLVTMERVLVTMEREVCGVD